MEQFYEVPNDPCAFEVRAEFVKAVVHTFFAGAAGEKEVLKCMSHFKSMNDQYVASAYVPVDGCMITTESTMPLDGCLMKKNQFQLASKEELRSQVWTLACLGTGTLLLQILLQADHPEKYAAEVMAHVDLIDSEDLANDFVDVLKALAHRFPALDTTTWKARD